MGYHFLFTIIINMYINILPRIYGYNVYVGLCSTNNDNNNNNINNINNNDSQKHDDDYNNNGITTMI